MILLLFVVSANAMHSDYFMEPRTIILEDGKELYIRGIFTGEIELIDSNLGCNSNCISSCLPTSEGLAAVQCAKDCGCEKLISENSILDNAVNEEINELYPKTEVKPYNERNIKWWLDLKSKKLRNYDTCSLECDSFCSKMKNNLDHCSNNCVSKFCEKHEEKGFNTYYWIIFSIIFGGFSYLLFTAYKKRYFIAQSKESLHQKEITGYKLIEEQA